MSIPHIERNALETAIRLGELTLAERISTSAYACEKETILKTFAFYDRYRTISDKNADDFIAYGPSHDDSLERTVRVYFAAIADEVIDGRKITEFDEETAREILSRQAAFAQGNFLKLPKIQPKYRKTLTHAQCERIMNALTHYRGNLLSKIADHWAYTPRSEDAEDALDFILFETACDARHASAAQNALRSSEEYASATRLARGIVIVSGTIDISDLTRNNVAQGFGKALAKRLTATQLSEMVIASSNAGMKF